MPMKPDLVMGPGRRFEHNVQWTRRGGGLSFLLFKGEPWTALRRQLSPGVTGTRYWTWSWVIVLGPLRWQGWKYRTRTYRDDGSWR